MIGFAVGPFDIHPLAAVPGVSAFCPPFMRPLMISTVDASLPSIIEFFEELLSARLPYASYKIVFVDQVRDFC